MPDLRLLFMATTTTHDEPQGSGERTASYIIAPVYMLVVQGLHNPEFCCTGICSRSSVRSATIFKPLSEQTVSTYSAHHDIYSTDMGLTPIDDEVSLPLLSKLGITEPMTVTDEELPCIAASFIRSLSDAISSNNIESATSLFFSECLWRDFLAFTWELITIFRVENVRDMLKSRLEKIQISNVRLSKHRDLLPSKIQPVPILLMLNIPFEFDTSAGSCTGIANIIPIPSDNGVEWKIYTLYTNLDQIKGCLDQVGPNRKLSLGNYVQQREKDIAFENEDPLVIIVGSGHSGCCVAARLKAKSIPYLVIEKNERIGDNWRNRYDTLTLHDFAWMATLPYFPFPADWPLFTPAQKFADWLDLYAKALDLNVWTSTTVTKAERDEVQDQWAVHVTKADGSKRVFRSKYLVAATGLGVPKTPDIPGMDRFRGKMMHAYSYQNSEEHVGKKVAVVGSATAGHDISENHCLNGIDVTMVQRASTCVIKSPEGINIFLGPSAVENDVPIEIKDRRGSSMPTLVAKKFQMLAMKRVIETHRSFYDALENVGFKVNHGIDGAGFATLARQRLGGFYIDVGASQMIIDKKIKIKSGSIKEVTPEGLIFEDESTLEADVIIWATGLDGPQSSLQSFLSPELREKLRPPLKLSDEGEFDNAYTESGLKNFFFIVGNLPMCRMFSSHISLVIKAKEEGLYNGPYRHTHNG